MIPSNPKHSDSLFSPSPIFMLGNFSEWPQDPSGAGRGMNTAGPWMGLVALLVAHPKLCKVTLPLAQPPAIPRSLAPEGQNIEQGGHPSYSHFY